MIVGDLKPIHEIVASLNGFNKVLVLGCGSCVTVCLSGGDREAQALARTLTDHDDFEGKSPGFETDTILRQCEQDLVATYQTLPEDIDAILSLACGAGVQIVADAFTPLPVIPALNTTFLGAAAEPGVWEEMCQGCGDCILFDTGGICPVARCAKSLFNGPCGGSQSGHCEIDPDVTCVWAAIYERLKKQKKLHRIHKIRTAKDWRPGGAAGPRKRNRTGIGGSPGES
jgi:ferredoxin